MARALNKSRIMVSKVLGLIVLLCVFFTTSAIQDESTLHEVFDVLGLLFVFICALGRLYTTAFLGGKKNKDLITHGPFSVVRNPLYVCSLIGFTGVAFMTNHVILMVLVPLSFTILYHFLVSREEQFLKETFGREYEGYCAKVHRFVPSFSLWQQPKSITLDTKMFFNGLKDALWWFAAFPLVEIVEYVHEINLVPSLFFVP
ncbi:MAG: hypothetical protein CMH27_02455 [Micavibrio sp.]|nr:hypothetical protein [Micavibrio sp.]